MPAGGVSGLREVAQVSLARLRRPNAQRAQLVQLLGRQQILDADCEANVQSLDFPLDGEHGIELRDDLLLVRLIRFQRINQAFDRTLHFELLIDGRCLHSLDFRDQGRPLRLRQMDCRLMLHDEFGREDLFPDRVGSGTRTRTLRVGERQPQTEE